MTLVASYERLIRGRGQELKPGMEEEEAATASIPARSIPASIPTEPVVPAALELPATLEVPATVAAKPTETAVKSPPPETSETGIRHE